MNKATARMPGSSRWLWLSILVIIVDQVSKQWIIHTYGLYDRVDFFSMFAFQRIHNTGAAFGLFADQPGWQRWFFITLAAVVSVVIMIWLRRLPRGQTILAVGLALVLGGALGNVIDRAVYGYVVDFILVHYQEREFPTFNLADTAISIGAFLLIWDAFLPQQKKAPNEGAST